MKVVAWMSAALAAVDEWREGPRERAPAHGRPVVLVHGIYSSSHDFTRLTRHLEREGRAVHCLDFTHGNGRCSLVELARQLQAFVDEKSPRERVELVGFSMGGLVSRYYLQRLGGMERVAHFVSLAAPHAGTILARVNRLPGVLEMRRGSEFLRDLERDQESLRNIKVTSIYTPLDLIIVPAWSSRLPQARNVVVWAALHPSLILEKRCLRAISAALTETKSR